MSRALRLLPLALLLPALAACEKANAVHGPSELACNKARGEVASAVESYSILQAKQPTSEMDLVPKFLNVPSELMDVVNGQVVPQPGAGCD